MFLDLPSKKSLKNSRSSLNPCSSFNFTLCHHKYVLFTRVAFTIVLLLWQDLYSVPRTILPHGASFHGHLLTLNVTYESTKDTFTIEVCVHRLHVMTCGLHI